jgi:hypothetical protein
VFPYDERKLLFRNLGTGRFEDVTARAGAPFTAPEVSRGAAFGDIDNDGDTDVVVHNINGPARLLINEIGNRQHWIGLRVTGAGGRDMLGTIVEIERPLDVARGRSGVTTLRRRARSDGSYASASDPRVLAGLGQSSAVPIVRIHWPDGQTEERRDLPIDRWSTIRQGER